MSQLLADFFRQTLRLGGLDRVTLSQEIDLVSRYLAIEKIRFGDRLTLDIGIDDRAGSLVVPPLILQPLVENAVRHGVALQPGAGWIRIRADRLGDHLRVAISNSDPSRSDGGRSNGVGLANTRERLRQLYGDEATLELSRHEGEVRATMSIPHRRLAATVS